MQHQKISLLLALCFLFTIVLFGCGETTEPKKQPQNRQRQNSSRHSKLEKESKWANS